MNMKKLYRDRQERVIGGVIAGVVKYFKWNIDLSVIRVLFVVFTLLSQGFGVVLYLISWAIIPNEPKNFEEEYSDKNL